ncbi:hypothetical protein M8C21_031076, partial [Ambrosia artemisiifolia]
DPAWGNNIVWAHSVSKDMMNWIPLERAIIPLKHIDKYGCWSGSAIILPGNKPVILYMGIIARKPTPGYQVQKYAIPTNHLDPFLREWIKPDDNPILKPTSRNVSAFRNPTTAWFHNGHWKMTVGSKRNQRGIAYLYKSRDFVKWTKAKHTLHDKKGKCKRECPDFYPISTQGSNIVETSTLMGGIKHVLKDKYYPDGNLVGGWAGLRYDYGNFYTSKTFFDPVKKRRILWGWANKSSSAIKDVVKGWAGIQWRIHELKSLRGDKLNKGDIDEIKGITTVQIHDPKWSKLPSENLASLICGITGGLRPFGFLTLASNKLKEYTPVFFRVFKTKAYKPSFAGFVGVDLSKKKLALKSLIDHSVVESFGEGGKMVITSRVYPTLAVSEHAHLYLFNNGSE